MGEAAEHAPALAAHLADGLLGGREHPLRGRPAKRSHVIAVSKVSASTPIGDEHVAQVGRAEERPAPGARPRRRPRSQRRPASHRAAVLARRARAPAPSPRSTGWSLDSKPSTSSAWRAVAGQRERGLARRRADGSWTGAARTGRSRARTRAPSPKRSKRTPARAAVRRPRLHTHPRLGDHPERALRAGEHPVWAHARARSGQPPRLPGAGGRDRAHRLDEILDVGPHGGEVPGRARGDPAAERGVLERLREVAQRQPVLAAAAPRATGPSAPPWIRAERETASTSSTRSSAPRSTETTPL